MEFRPQKRSHSEFLEAYNSSQGSTILASTGTSAAPVSDNANHLCSECAALNIDYVFRKKVRSRRGNFIRELSKSASELEASNCILCRLFGSVAPRQENEEADADPKGVTLQVRVFSFVKVFVGTDAARFPVRDTALLGVIDVSVSHKRLERPFSAARIEASLQKTGYLSLHSTPKNSRPRELGVRLIRPESFNVDFAKRCMVYCQENHGENCKQAAGAKLSRFFKVIDCKTGDIVKAPTDCKYVALSYVWGAPEPTGVQISIDEPRNIFTAGNCPAVIRDASVVTLSLNLQYLWVDRFCINQSDAEDEDNQICQMDLIYAMAHVTIIAATRNSKDGLPGALGSKTTRKHQPCATIGGFTLASTLPNPQKSLAESKWVTRGWTYQEGILSKRRLIFTETQIVFECSGMHYPESLVLPLDHMHQKTKRDQSFRPHVPVGPLGPKSPSTNPFMIMSYVSEFSKRKLSYPGDRINAMRGILNASGTDQIPVYQLMGVPIIPFFFFPEKNRHFWSKFQQFLKIGFLVGLTWSHDEPGAKVPQFPTWSWAGWAGVPCPDFMFTWEVKITFDDTNVLMERDDGHLVPLPLERRYLADLERQHPRFIHLDVYTLPCSIVKLDEKDLSEICPGIICCWK
jgi:hypothetical protein